MTPDEDGMSICRRVGVLSFEDQQGLKVLLESICGYALLMEEIRLFA